MKRIFVILFCLTIPCNAVKAETKFNDVDGHWAEEVIEKWQDAGYINGYPDGSFKPDNSVTRAELSKILSSAFDLSESQQISYEDVSNDEWYYSYLQTSDKYIPSYPLPVSYESNVPYRGNFNKSKFLPDVKTIRMHVAEALVEIKMEKDHISTEDLSMPETVQEISYQLRVVYQDEEYHNLFAIPHTGIPGNVQRMNRYTWLAYKLNIMEGHDGYFYPYGYMTRAELLTAIDRMIE